MNSVFTKVCFDIHCDWQGLPPVYRIYLDEELFSERTWIWTEHYLREMLQIQAPPGQYQLRLESVPPNLAKFSITNFCVIHGPARWMEQNILEISNESQ